MSEDVRQTDPSGEMLEDIPEVDFSGGIRPNRYANLRGEFQHAVFLDRQLWEHFGSAEKVVAALRMLVELAEREVKRSPGHERSINR